MIKKYITPLLLLLLFCTTSVWAQKSFTATYTWGNDGNVSSFAYNGTDYTNDGLTFDNFTKVGVTSSSKSGSFRANNWPLVANGFQSDKYFQFSITVTEGYILDLGKINFGIGRSKTGTRKTEWRSSVDNYTTTINNYTTLNEDITNSGGVLENPDPETDNGYTGNELELSSSEFQEVTGTITFRVYFYESEVNTGTAGLQGPLTVTGSVTKIPAFTLSDDNNPAGANINQGTNNALLLGFAITPDEEADFTAASLAIDTDLSDTEVTNFRLVQDVNENGVFDDGTDTIVQTVSAFSDGKIEFSGLAETLSAKTYYLVIADIDVNATENGTLSLSLDPSDMAGDLDFSGDKIEGNTFTVKNPSAPQISVLASLSHFGKVATHQSSLDAQSYTVSGLNLNDAEVLTVSVTGDFEISKTEIGGYGKSLQFNPNVNGEIISSTIYVQFTPQGDSLAGITGKISHSFTGLDLSGDDIPLEGFALSREPDVDSFSSIFEGSFSDVGETSFKLSWVIDDEYSEGLGADSLLILVKKGAAVDVSLENGTAYLENSVFGSGSEIGTGNFVVYKGVYDDGNVTVSGLDFSSTYHYAVFAFNASDTYPLTQNYEMDPEPPVTGNVTTTGPDYLADFEDALKTGYAKGNITVNGIEWTLDSVLVGDSANDKKNGSKSVRIQNGYIQMNEDYVGGVDTFSFEYAQYGTDGAYPLETSYSIDGGATYTSLGTVNTTTKLQTVSYDVNIITPVRFKIEHQNGRNKKRANVDDIRIYNTNTGDAYKVISGTAGWRMLSAPVSGFKIGDIADNTAIQGISGGDHSSFDANVFLYGSNGTWTSPASLSTVFGNGYGFITYFYNNSKEGSSELPLTLDVNGTEPTENVVVALNSDKDENGSYFTLVGNPFGANLDAGEITVSGGSIQNTFQTWSNENGTYVAEDHTAGLTVSPWTGFWVESADGASSITIPVSARTSSAGSNHLGKALPRDSNQDISNASLAFSLSSAYNTDSNFKVQFVEGADFGWDLWDATKIYSLNPNFVSGAIQSQRNGKSYLKSVESLPAQLQNAVEIPLEILISGETQQVELSWSGLDRFPANWSFELVDLENGKVMNLREVETYSFTVESVVSKASAQNRLNNPVLQSNGNARFKVNVNPGTEVTGIGQEIGIPNQLSLNQNYPNPFNPSTKVSFDLPAQSRIRLAVYDMLGREVAVLAQGQKSAGHYEYHFDASNLASGMYIYRLEANGSVLTKKMTLIK